MPEEPIEDGDRIGVAFFEPLDKKWAQSETKDPAF